MGLFTSSRQPTSSRSAIRDVTLNANVYVLARSTTRSNSFDSSESRPSWSLCVQESSNQDGSSLRYSQPKKPKSIFNLKRKPAQSNVSSPTSTQASSSPTHFIDFSLGDGNLSISRPSLKLPFTPAPHSDDVLLQILLPTEQTPTTIYQQSLSTRLEQRLHVITSSQSNLHNQQSDLWIRFVLIALQQNSNLLPHPPTFDVNDFMSFAQNQLTELEAEVLSRTHINDDDDDSRTQNSRVKLVNYQSHVQERTRLKKLVSQNYVANGDEERDEYGSGEMRFNEEMTEGQEDLEARAKTSWWNNGPQVAETKRDHDRDVDVDRDEPRGFL